MNTKKFREKIMENWLAKIVCFVLALVIYFFHQISVLDKKTFTVPLTVVDNGKMTTTEDFNNNRYVKVTVRGKTEQLNTVTEKDFVAYIDVTSQTENGKYQLPVQIKSSERLSLLDPLELSTTPEKVNVTLEESIFRYVPVSATLAGEPAYGYEVSEIKVNPSTVRVTGAKTMVESISAVQTDKVEVADMTEETVQNVKIVNNNRMINVDTYTPVEVSVEITPVIQTKELAGIDVVYSNLKDDIEIISPRENLTVQIEGPLLTLDRITSRNVIASADCSTITENGTFTVPVYIIAPSSVKIVGQSIVNVTLTSRIKSEEEQINEDVIDDEEVVHEVTTVE